MAIMPIRRLILNVTRVNSNLPSLLLRSPINILIRHGFTPPLLTQHLGNSLGERGFTVVDMANGADVDVRFVSVEFIAGGSEGAAG